jgi:hypothetical protein
MIILDARDDEVWEEQLVKYPDLHGVNLAEFWNRYDATAES